MAARARTSLMTIIVLLVSSTMVLAAESKTGFLVVAQDRGFLGNQEVREIVLQFQKEYPAALGLIGREYTGVEGEYAVYLTRAIQELKKSGVMDIVAIPLFLSAADPVLQRAMPTLSAYAAGLPVRWVPAMADSYLTSQIVLDRVEALSQQFGPVDWPIAPGRAMGTPSNGYPERLILVGIGATDEASEKSLKEDTDKLLAYVQRYKHFRDAEVVIYYDREAEEAEKQNQEIKAHVLALIAKQGRTLVVPTFIGPKFDQAMSLTAWLGRQFKGLNVAYQGVELLPHPNVLLWLKRTANQFVAARPDEIGVVIMPHGSTQPWNDAVERTIEPLKTKYKIEMAYGMGDPGIIQDAVSRLEQQGIKRIVFARMYALEDQMKALTDYILGLRGSSTPTGQGDSSPEPKGTVPLAGHDHDATFPQQIRSAALFSTFGGYEEYAGIAEVICERITEISKEPAKETVILLAHGSKADEDNAKWLSVMNANLERVKKHPHCARLKTLKAATVREDWPELREKAVADVRKLIEEGSQDGRVLVIADRLYGSGPYKKMLKGLDYVLNENGFASPVITRWLEDGIGRTVTALMNPADKADCVAQR